MLIQLSKIALGRSFKFNSSPVRPLFLRYLVEGSYTSAVDSLRKDTNSKVVHSYGDRIVIQDCLDETRKWIVEDQTVNIQYIGNNISELSAGDKFSLTQNEPVISISVPYKRICKSDLVFFRKTGGSELFIFTFMDKIGDRYVFRSDSGIYFTENNVKVTVA